MTESNRSSTNPRSDIERAIDAFRAGDPVLIHDFDDREDEADLVYPAEAVTPNDVAQLRNHAGGLICVALPYEVAETFDLPFLADELNHPCAEIHELEYDDRSSFSLPVNHKNTRTGIPDNERALTIAELGAVSADPGTITFQQQFRAPGHVHLLKGAPGGVTTRQGHTELSLQLAREADQSPATVVCEMLDDVTGDSLSGEAARAYAREQDIPFVTGKQILRATR